LVRALGYQNGKIMTPEQKEDWNKTLWRSRVELPYPLNYLWRENPGLAYMIVKVGDKLTSLDRE
jgi:hypothetical protein